jgi:alcohol dehydrogenase (cytochrome c)
MAWTVQLTSPSSAIASGVLPPPLQGSPIVAGGLMFMTGSHGDVVALNARTGDRVWRYERSVPSGLMLCCGAANRGVAILGDSVFVATLDAHLVALEASSGRQKWDVKVADFQEGYSMGSAPLAVGDRVIVGVSGGDFGARGFVAAFAAADGRALWKFHTVPEPGEFGHDTWAGDSWKTGGAATWITGAYDKELNLVYWGVANATPIFHAAPRAGDNLFSMCVIALDLSSGKLRWYFQFSPGDEHGWDASQQPIVARLVKAGEQVPVLLWANRNGFFYALDRRTGAFLFAKPFVKQTWAKGFEANGRPIVNPEPRPSATGTLVWPWEEGGTSWEPPSFDHERGLVFVPTFDAAGIYFRSSGKPERGKLFLGGASNLAQVQSTTAVKAIDAATGDIRWETRLEEGFETRRGAGGVLSTSGGLVFTGYRDDFIGFDADTGKELWRVRLGGVIRAAPVAYAVDGRQFIAVAGGTSLFAFGLPADRP